MAQKKEEQTIKVQFVAEVDDSTPSYYCNFIQVGHNPYDFSLTFAKIPVQPTANQLADAKAGNSVKIPAMINITFPLNLSEGLINALSIQKQKYETQFGVIHQPVKGPETNDKKAKNKRRR